jgi:hypothetical protein
MRVAILAILISTAGFARTWSGFLVDARCWEDVQSNVGEGSVTGEQSMNFDVHECSPTARTTSFDVVLTNWCLLKLDHNGDVRAEQLVQHTHKKPVYGVNVSGVLTKKTIRVASIAPRTICTASRHASFDY